MLSFTYVYFFESRLFNGLRGTQVKKSGAGLSVWVRGLGRIRLACEFERTRRLRPLPVGFAGLVVGNLADLLQVLLHRGRDDLVDAKVGGDAVDLVQELLARFVVIGLVRAGDRLIAIEPVEHF